MSIFANIPLKKLFLLWACWAILILGFQQLVPNRFQPQRPDRVLFWTDTETGRLSQNDKPYLIEPFLNEHVSFDSEYYLSIAIAGYDDPIGRDVSRGDETYNLNYAFFPFYPFVISLVAKPLAIFGLNPIATHTLAGVIVSLLATLAAIISLFDLSQDKLGKDGAFRAVFYFLIFPTAFFLAQVYTEALFVALTFTSLAVMYRSNGHFRWMLLAAILAGLATITRAVGIALAFALIAQSIANEPEGYQFTLCPPPTTAFLQGLLFAAVPIGVYFVWSFSNLGEGFHFVETNFFGRGALMIVPSMYGWSLALTSIYDTSFLTGAQSQTAVYFAIEITAVLLALFACFKVRKNFPALFMFSILAWTIAVFSGSPQSNVRYMLALPALFVFLGSVGRHPVFDRIWTMGSILLLAILTALYTFDFWVA